MTNVMDSDRDLRCLQAGMNDYLANRSARNSSLPLSIRVAVDEDSVSEYQFEGIRHRNRHGRLNMEAARTKTGDADALLCSYGRNDARRVGQSIEHLRQSLAARNQWRLRRMRTP